MQIIKKDLKTKVSRIKCSGIRKSILKGVLDSLKDHYARVWDFGNEILEINPNKRFDIRTTRVIQEEVNIFRRI